MRFALLPRFWHFARDAAWWGMASLAACAVGFSLNGTGVAFEPIEKGRSDVSRNALLSCCCHPEPSPGAFGRE